MILDVFSLVLQEFFSWTRRVNFFSHFLLKKGRRREKDGKKKAELKERIPLYNKIQKKATKAPTFLATKDNDKVCADSQWERIEWRNEL